MRIKPWTIYMWRNETDFQAAAQTLKDGVKHTFCFGWLIEEDPDATKNSPQHQEWRAVNQLRKILNNTLNAVKWYGNKILTEEGEIDPHRFNFMEQMTAYEATKKAQARGRDVQIVDLRKEKKFMQINITRKQAKELKFI